MAIDGMACDELHCCDVMKLVTVAHSICFHVTMEDFLVLCV